MTINPYDHELILKLMTEVEEVVDEVRKGVPQSYYVGKVDEDAEYWDGRDMVLVPEHIVGYYVMPYSADLTCIDFTEAMQRFGFVKCERVEVITHTYKKL